MQRIASVLAALAIAAQSATFAANPAMSSRSHGSAKAETPSAQPAKPFDAAQGRPNIVVILADDLGYGDVHCFNPQHGKIPTPSLDKLAAQGLMFTDAHSGSAVCTPTRYGLLTGRYAWRSWLKNWVLFDHMPLLIDPQTPTIQRTLKENGYTTGIIGKWHLGWGSDINADWNHEVKPGPLETGFDYSYAMCWGVNVPGKPAWPAFVENRRMVGLNDGDDINNPDTRNKIIHDPHDTGLNLAARATDYIRQNKKGPFFLYLPTFNVHWPIAPNAKFKSKLGAYADYVSELDWIVSQVTDTLEKEGLADNTLVIFTSDNGSNARGICPRGHKTSGPWRGGKGDIYEGGHRVPFIVRWPGKVAPGSTSAATICLNDIYATLTGALGIAKPQGGAPDSFDFSPLFDKTHAAEFRRPPVIHHSVAGMFAIRDGDWKLILGLNNGHKMNMPKAQAWAVNKPIKDPVTGKIQDLMYPVDPFPQPKPGEPAGQLFNLKDDPGETTNLYAKHPEIVQRLTDELKAIRKVTADKTINKNAAN